MLNVHLSALGCRLNEAELEAWSRALRAAGHRVVEAPEQASVLVLNTCAVTAEAARKSRQHARRLHRQNPRARLVVTGCYAALEPERVAALTGVDLVLGARDKERLVARLVEDLDPHSMPRLATEPDSAPVHAAARTRAFIKVQDGCRNRCAFCVVTLARGQERSRPLGEVIEEVRARHAEGFQEVVLAGVHLGGYGHDRGASLRDLVAAVLDHTDVARVRLGSLEPWDLPDDFWSLWQRSARLCPHLHLPLQSGCDGVLRRMARRCMTADYEALVERARAAIDGLMISTDLIVGFPGERDEDWEATRRFITRVGFGDMHVFTYSPRPGTRAAALPEQIPGAVKRARSAQAHALAAQMKGARLEAEVGARRPVLWEGRGEPAAPGQRRWRGYTDSYLRAQTLAPDHLDLAGLITPARATAVVDGERLAVTADLPAALSSTPR